MKYWLFKCFFFSFLFNSIILEAVQSEQKMLLTDALKTIENVYDIKFSFDAESIDSIEVIINPVRNLSSLLKEITAQTSLKIEKIDTRYYVLSKPEERDKTSLCGIILDNFSKKPIKGATVLNLNTGEISKSNLQGRFILQETSNNDKILIEYPNYPDYKLLLSELRKPYCKNIFIGGNTQMLQEVLITDYLKNDTFDNKPGTTRFDPNRNTTYPDQTDPDVLKMLQVLPGIQSITETASGTNIRGNNQNHNLVLWNGIKVYRTGHFFGTFSAFNPKVISDVALYRSGTNPKFGGAVSGIIEFNGPTSTPHKFTAGVGSSLTNADAYIKTPISKNAGIVVSARRSLTDLIETATFDQYNQRIFQTVLVLSNDQNAESIVQDESTNSYFEDYTAKLLFEIGKRDTLSLSGIYTGNATDYRRDLINIEDPDIEFNKRQKQFLTLKNQGASLFWKHSFSNKLSSTVTGYYARNTQTFESKVGQNSADFNEISVNSFSTMNEYSMTFSGSWNINSKNQLTAGYEITSTDIQNREKSILNPGTNEETTDIDDSRNQANYINSVYANYEVRPLTKLKLTMGVRNSTFSVLNNKKIYTEPRLILEIAHNESFTTRYSYEVKNQVVLDQSFAFDRDFGIRYDEFILAENEKDLLNGSQLTAGALFSKNRLDVNIDLYYKNTNGLSTTTSDFDLFIPPDLGKSTVYGLDFFLKKKFKNYQFLLSYSYSQNTYKFEALKNGQPFDGNFDIPHSFTFNQNYRYKNFDIVLGWKIRSGLPFSRYFLNEDNMLTLDSEGINSERLPVYHRLDFTTAYSFRLSAQKSGLRGKLALSLINLYDQRTTLDKDFFARLDSSQDGDDRFFVEVDTKSLGFTPNISLSIQF